MHTVFLWMHTVCVFVHARGVCFCACTRCMFPFIPLRSRVRFSHKTIQPRLPTPVPHTSACHDNQTDLSTKKCGISRSCERHRECYLIRIWISGKGGGLNGEDTVWCHAAPWLPGAINLMKSFPIYGGNCYGSYYIMFRVCIHDVIFYYNASSVSCFKEGKDTLKPLHWIVLQWSIQCRAIAYNKAVIMALSSGPAAPWICISLAQMRQSLERRYWEEMKSALVCLPSVGLWHVPGYMDKQ